MRVKTYDGSHSARCSHGVLSREGAGRGAFGLESGFFTPCVAGSSPAGGTPYICAPSWENARSCGVRCDRGHRVIVDRHAALGEMRRLVVPDFESEGLEELPQDVVLERTRTGYPRWGVRREGRAPRVRCLLLGLLDSSFRMSRACARSSLSTARRSGWIWRWRFLSGSPSKDARSCGTLHGAQLWHGA